MQGYQKLGIQSLVKLWPVQWKLDAVSKAHLPQGKSIVSSLSVGIPPALRLKNNAGLPFSLVLPYERKDSLDCLCLCMDPRLTLVIGEAVQGAGIKIDFHQHLSRSTSLLNISSESERD
jgi:hypothetical protein